MILTLFAAFGCFVRRSALRGPYPFALRLGRAKPVLA